MAGGVTGSTRTRLVAETWPQVDGHGFCVMMQGAWRALKPSLHTGTGRSTRWQTQDVWCSAEFGIAPRIATFSVRGVQLSVLFLAKAAWQSARWHSWFPLLPRGLIAPPVRSQRTLLTRRDGRNGQRRIGEGSAAGERISLTHSTPMLYMIVVSTSHDWSSGLTQRDIRRIDPSLWVTNAMPALLVSESPLAACWLVHNVGG